MMIRFTVTIGIYLLLLSVLEITVFARHSLFGATPDLMLFATLCVAFFYGRYAGAITGIAAGFLIEAMGSVGITVLPLFYFLFGYLAGTTAGSSSQKNYPFYLLFCLPVALLYRAALTVIYASLLFETVNLPQIFLSIVLPEMGDTALCGALLYFPSLLLCRILDRRK